MKPIAFGARACARVGAVAVLLGGLLPSGPGLAQDFDVRLRARTLSAEAIDPELTRALGSSGGRPVHGILRFARPLTAADHAAIRGQGVVLLEYLERQAYLASIPPTATLAAVALPGLRGADRLRGTDKLAAGFVARPPRWTVASAIPLELNTTVEFHRDLSRDEAAALLRSPTHGRFVQIGRKAWTARLSPRAAGALADRDEVKRIQAAPAPPLPLTQTQRTSIRTEQLQQIDIGATPPAYQLDGATVRIGVCDEGADTTHPDLWAVGDDREPSVLRVDPIQTGTAHGTHVASIVGGSGLVSEWENLAAFDGRGHAPNVHIGDYEKFQASVEGHHRALVLHGMQATNHSYVQSWTDYDATARALDEIIRGDATYQGQPIPARPQVWSAGNNGVVALYPYSGGTEAGYHSVHTTAKNSISVGSVDAPHHGLTPLSSLGPTFDGRLKPDLVAPGCRDPAGIMAATPYYDGYIGMCGTSMAAPAVTGAIALMLQRTRGMPELPPSSYRAALIHTARDLEEEQPSATSDPFNSPDTGVRVKFHAGPDYATGWGLVDAEAAAGAVADRTQWRHRRIAQGEQDTWCVRVPLFAGEIRATLAWDDLPGSTLTGYTVPKLVNDLDLQLVSPSGTVVAPWTLPLLPLQENASGVPTETFGPQHILPAQRDVDRRNNVEVASWSSPGSGQWQVVVVGHALPMDGTQLYSLVSSAPFEVCN